MLPKGFLSSGIHSGIKKDKSNKDLGLIYSEEPCNYAGIFTQNSVKAHCVTDNQNSLKDQCKIQCVLVNSGNANACTGTGGLQALEEVKSEISKELGLQTSNTLTASTGVIGQLLPVKVICTSVKGLKDSLSENYKDFAEAILTTDTKTKVIEKEVNGCKIVGIAKGAGMIHPNMATMLAFILTDVVIEHEELQKHLQESNKKSFNQISVDGDTSTNDMVLLLTNGASKKTVEPVEFQKALNEVCINLAKQIAADGEGATKLIEVTVKGANSEEEAAQIAKGMVSSSLVKSAVFGADPNWGRLLSSAGQNGSVDLDKVQLKIFDKLIVKNGQPTKINLEKLSKAIKDSKEIEIELDLGGNSEITAQAWGCDLTYDYVKINAEYTT